MTQMHFQTRLRALEEIRDGNGGHLTPAAVVDASRSANAPLHNEFEWNDGIAAELHRQEQARNLIRSIRIESVANSPRMFHATIVTGEREYRTLDEIKLDEDLREQVVARLRRNLEAAMRDLEYLQEPSFEAARGHLGAALQELQH